MAIERVNDLQAFKNFVDAQLAQDSVPTLDEVLARWDVENETAEDNASTIQALREALAEMEAGDTGIPVHEALAELRRKHHLL